MIGSWNKAKRTKIESLIQDAGGQLTKVLSEEVDYVLVGKRSGSKLKKAETLGS